MDTYIGADTTEFLVKLAAGLFSFHLVVAILSSAFQLSWYQTLTAAESSVVQGFVTWFFNILGDAWHRFVGIFFGG